MKFEDFLDQRLFGPLGMKDTTFWPTKEQQARLAKSYKGKADKSDLEVTGVGQLVLSAGGPASRADAGRRAFLDGAGCGALLPDAAERRGRSAESGCSPRRR